tara:strand:- start:113 stop:874 length:762 start_codon:yes stop_codon:yes gene_type:complete
MNKTILITGSSSGIGKDLAIKFAKKNWTVIGLSRRLPVFDKSLSKKVLKNIVSYSLDITKKKEVNSRFKIIFLKHGIPDIFFLNAGTNNPNSKHIVNYKETKKIFEVNYFGTLNCLEPILNIKKSMSKSISQLVIMSSVAGYRGLPHAAAYCSSKAALIALAESIYNECKLIGLDVRVLNPGFIKTPLTDRNNFPMPMIITSIKAADIIYKKLLNSNSFEISLPWFFCTIMKTLKILPYFFYMKITKKIMKKL